MTQDQVWQVANGLMPEMLAIFNACDDKVAHEILDGLVQRYKQHIPCMMGVDAESRTLLYSCDEGPLAIRMEIMDGSVALIGVDDPDIEIPGPDQSLHGPVM